MSSKPVLTYFNFRARGEIARWIFAVAGVQYEDKRVTSEEWQKLKSDSPTGGLPMLEIDGVELGQSGAISMYLARKYGLAGASDVENALIHMIVDSIGDLLQKYVKIRFCKDKAEQAELTKTFHEKDVPAFFGVVKKRLGEKKWLVGNEMTVADIAVASFLHSFSLVEATGMAKHVEGDAAISKLVQQVTDNPKIKQWIESRPKTEF